MLTLARATEALDVAFIATPQTIDQLHVGMQGFLTVTSLPKRQHPKVRVTISALSPEARRDRDGHILGYDGIAIMDPNDRHALQEELGDNLSQHGHAGASCLHWSSNDLWRLPDRAVLGFHKPSDAGLTCRGR